jgi:hypothetical protein
VTGNKALSGINKRKYFLWETSAIVEANEKFPEYLLNIGGAKVAMI